MFNSLISDLLNAHSLIHNVWLWPVIAFLIWMFVDAIRRREWLWAIFIFIGWGITALIYFFFVYRAAAPSATRGFELPGAQSRKRIKELQAQIHHLDNAYHHFLLGDVYFQRGNLAEAEKCYRAALQRDATDIDTRAHLGQCLVRLNRPAEARPFLESVMHEKPETLTALGETDNALQYWQHITQNHSYPRAKVQLAELYLAKNQPELARAELKDIVSDDQHAPAFQRKRDRVWVRRAKSLMGKL
jgi:tetratricopeptide (TPR) repeat protein